MSKTLAIVVATVALAGCGTTRLVNSDVNTFGAWPDGRAPASFVFERLPSQEARAPEQEQLEAAALPALEHAGFKQVSSGAADVMVQVAARTLHFDRIDPFYDPFWRGNAFYYNRWRGAGLGLGLGAHYGTPYYVNEVSLLIRDGKSKQVLYETRAQNDGRGSDEGVRMALFEAALKDFPRTAISPRRVTVEVPR